MLWVDLSKYLLTMALCFQASLVFCKPSVVLLKGTSSAGKSSVCKELKQLDETWVIIEEDKYFHDKHHAILARSHPQEFSAIARVIFEENIFHAIWRGEVCFNHRSLETDRVKALTAIEAILQTMSGNEGKNFSNEVSVSSLMAMLDDIDQALMNGRHVLIDSPSPGAISYNILKEQFNDYPIIRALAYSSLPHTIAHLHQRNEEALLTGRLGSKRFYRQVLAQYLNLYRLTDNPVNAVASNTMEEIDAIFCIMEANVLQNDEEESFTGFSRQEMNLRILKQLKEHLIPNFSNQTLYIQPIEDYDLILYTGEMPPVTSARILLNSPLLSKHF